MIKRAVGDGDMACLVLVIRTVHADIDRFAAVHESEVFKMDVTAVDPQANAVSEQRNALLLCGGKVNVKAFFIFIKVKCSCQFSCRFKGGDPLEFDP